MSELGIESILSFLRYLALKINIGLTSSLSLLTISLILRLAAALSKIFVKSSILKSNKIL